MPVYYQNFQKFLFFFALCSMPYGSYPLRKSFRPCLRGKEGQGDVNGCTSTAWLYVCQQQVSPGQLLRDGSAHPSTG